MSLLSGMRIVDLTTIVLGPYATEVLADLGAEVIKVESPSGDMFRKVGAAAKTDGMGPCHLTLNRGKKSVQLDLKQPDQMQDMRRLIESADVFVTNVRGKPLQRLGLDYEAVSALNEKIVYVHCVGFGSKGRYRDLPAYDDVIQAVTGTATLLPRVDGNPKPRYLPSLIADKVAGLHAVYAVLAAVVHRLRFGEGQRVEVPMFESFTHFMMQEHLYGGAFRSRPYPMGYPRQLDPHRQPFPTADGYISIVLYTDDIAARVIEIIGDATLKGDARFKNREGRTKNSQALYAEMTRLLPARKTADWMQLFEAAGVPSMVMRDLDDMMNDPHLEDVGFSQAEEHPSEGACVTMRPPVSFSAQEHFEPRPAPRLGEHNGELEQLLQRRPTL